MTASIADNAMKFSGTQAVISEGHSAVGLATVTLSADYIGSAKTGQLLPTDTHLAKTGRCLYFAGWILLADAKPAAHANATSNVRQQD